tara:strand:- start:106612 stop:107394 length:783 start_codon:yes stop_codon:yes gene_type:complete
MFELRTACTLVLFAGAAALLPPTAKGLREFGSWALRPARLPFAWQAMQDATETGDAREAFARGQQIMQLVPSWSDGHSAMVYRYVLTHDDSENQSLVAEAAERRVYAGLARLEEARQYAGRREYGLLFAAANLPDIACIHFPGLAERLQQRQPGGAAAIANGYYDEAARLFPSPAVREQQLWYAPTLAASLLACGAKPSALQILDRAIARAPEIRDRKLATEWAQRLREVVAKLRGDNTVVLDKVFADQRFELLQPFLRD